VNQVDLCRGITVDRADLPLHHEGVRDHAHRAAATEERLLETNGAEVLRVQSLHDAADRLRKTRAPIEPRPMDAVARAINVAAPDALEAHENIAVERGAQPFQLVGKTQRRSALPGK
jgi:hypothetical protein